MSRLCFDFDTIKYAVGFASESRYIIATNKLTGNSLTLKNRTVLKTISKSLTSIVNHRCWCQSSIYKMSKNL